MTDMTVAKTIYEQLGGKRFSVMTGAKNFVGGKDYLSFRLPGAGGFCKNGINVVTVTLAPSDTYDVKFARIRGSKVNPVESRSGVYADQLNAVFSECTGLATSL